MFFQRKDVYTAHSESPEQAWHVQESHWFLVSYMLVALAEPARSKIDLYRFTMRKGTHIAQFGFGTPTMPIQRGHTIGAPEREKVVKTTALCFLFIMEDRS